jgi:DNA adenine methylase
LQGRFNVPPGTPREIGIEDNHFRDVSAVLQHAKLCNSDFQYLIEQADSGDLLFIDPSYTVRHSNNGFIRYNEALFSWNDQERLAACLIEAQSRGVHIIATNAPHESIKQLYAKHFKMLEVDRFSSISGKADSRRRYNELIILSSSSRQIDV